jgi:lysophospholipase L1-like esterase
VPEVNQQLAAFAETHRGVTLADWDGTIVGVPGGLAGDDIHPNPSGGAAYAAAVQSALDELLERSEQPKRARSGR